MRKRILALGHDAHRAGAQVLFLHILRWLQANYEADISLVLADGGELLDEYASVLPTTVLPAEPTTDRPRGSKSLRGRIRKRRRPRRASLDAGGVDLIYANSAACGGLAAELADTRGCPVVCHIHELDIAIRRARGFRAASKRLDRYIAVSQAVQRNLVATYGIDPERIDRIHGGLPLPPDVPTTRRRSELRTALGIPSHAFVVGGCGTAEWRKGPDVFLLVAKALASRPRDRPVHFLWLGGGPGQLRMVQHDLDRLGLGESVTLVGRRPDPMSYFALFDAFLLTSREDPFPLVCLEAAAVGVPTVCFAGAGGMPEFVEDDAGCVVPYLDVEATADELLSLVDSECRRAALGRRAAEKVTERCSIDVVGPQIAAVLDRYLR